MITDFETNTIYFSELLKTDKRFTKIFEEITRVLKSIDIEPKLLPKTKDIWARDYMPIQVSEKRFVEYRYDPNYLQGDWKGSRDLKTYPDIVCDYLKLQTEKSDLIMDGGNFIKSSDCIILTDKIVKENRFAYSKKELIKKLQDTFQVDKVVLIPWDKLEEYGHADGMLRFINNKTVLVNYLYKDDSVLQYRLKQAGIKPEFLDYKNKTNYKLNWAYINFLQAKDLILLPKFNISEDEEAFKQIELYYPEYKGRVFQIDMTEIIQFGGALNCISWTIKE